MKSKFFATFGALSLVLSLSGVAPASGIDFTNTHNDPFPADISWAAENNITNGWPDGTFRPMAPVTREAMAAFIYRLADPGYQLPPQT